MGEDGKIEESNTGIIMTETAMYVVNSHLSCTIEYMIILGMRRTVILFPFVRTVMKRFISWLTSVRLHYTGAMPFYREHTMMMILSYIVD